MLPWKTPTRNKSGGPGALLAIYQNTKSGLTQEPENIAELSKNQIPLMDSIGQ